MCCGAKNLTFLTTMLLLAACPASSSNGKANGKGSGKSGKDVKERTFTLFATTELKGNIEPCGCTSNPMGDLARTVKLVADARAAGAVMYIDGGSTLYQEATIPEHLATQESRKAELLLGALQGPMAVAAMGLGPNDLSKGPAAVTPPRHAVNLSPDADVPTAPPEVLEIGGVKVGVFGVISGAATSLAVNPAPPAAQKAIATLRKDGAELIVALAYMTRPEAAALARAAPGMDIVLVGQGAPEPDRVQYSPSQIGTSWLIQPANRGQVVTRLDISVRAPGSPLTDAIGKTRADREIAQLSERLGKLDAKLAEWANDPDADADFVNAKKQERVEVAAKRDGLQKTPLAVPDSGSWFVMQQLPIAKALPCDAALQQSKVAFDKAIGESNVKASANKTVAKPADGKAGFVGIEECSMCHAKAVTFWQKTRHAQAWKTLADVGKEFSYDCVECHVTGWEKPGGSNLAVVAKSDELHNVQCEVCHDAGSIHADEDGKEKPKTLLKTPPEARCKECHTSDHSDTFDFKPYLRDVTGPGHGEAFRSKLGDGPSGHELRSAAKQKAGAILGAGCTK